MNILEHYNFESEYYEKLYGDYKDDVYTIQSLLPRGRILEIFCGTGRVISHFKGGIGIDNNRSMLIKGRGDFKRVLGDAFHLPFKSVFNFVIIALNSLLLFENEEKRRIISEVNRVTTTGAGLYIDIMNGFSLDEREYTISIYRDSTESIMLTLFPEKFEDRYILHYKYIIKKESKKIHKKDLIIYPISLKGITEILDNEGFEIKRKWGDYDLSPYSEKSDKIILEAIKKC